MIYVRIKSADDKEKDTFNLYELIKIRIEIDVPLEDVSTTNKKNHAYIKLRNYIPENTILLEISDNCELSSNCINSNDNECEKTGDILKVKPISIVNGRISTTVILKILPLRTGILEYSPQIWLEKKQRYNPLTKKKIHIVETTSSSSNVKFSLMAPDTVSPADSFETTLVVENNSDKTIDYVVLKFISPATRLFTITPPENGYVYNNHVVINDPISPNTTREFSLKIIFRDEISGNVKLSFIPYLSIDSIPQKANLPQITKVITVTSPKVSLKMSFLDNSTEKEILQGSHFIVHFLIQSPIGLTRIRIEDIFPETCLRNYTLTSKELLHVSDYFSKNNMLSFEIVSPSPKSEINLFLEIHPKCDNKQITVKPNLLVINPEFKKWELKTNPQNGLNVKMKSINPKIHVLAVNRLIEEDTLEVILRIKNAGNVDLEKVLLSNYEIPNLKLKEIRVNGIEVSHAGNPASIEVLSSFSVGNEAILKLQYQIPNNLLKVGLPNAMHFFEVTGIDSVTNNSIKTNVNITYTIPKKKRRFF